MKQILFGLSLAIFTVGVAAPASATIYTWRDASGTLVVSDRPLSPGAKSFAVPRAPTVRATRPLLSRPTTDYESLIQEHADRHGVRRDLVRAVIHVESAFNPRAVSPKGAKGLMQLMPGTASQFGVLNVFDPAENIRAGVGYLRQLLDRYSDNEELALAAYNAGPGAVDRYGTRVPPYQETKNYVKRIKQATALSAPAGRYIYKSLEIVNGRPVPRYSDSKPTSGAAFEIISVRK